MKRVLVAAATVTKLLWDCRSTPPVRATIRRTFQKEAGPRSRRNLFLRIYLTLCALVCTLDILWPFCRHL